MAKKRYMNQDLGEMVTGSRPTDYFGIRQKDQIKFVRYNEIYFFKAENKYVVVKTKGEEYLVNDSLVSIEQMVADRFIRIHRNALINLSLIDGMRKTKFDGWCVVFKEIDDVLSVSRRKMSTIRRWIKGVF